ncbi:MAG: Fic family protein [Bacteroidia bacterium]|nr:Fic family protein [Bacteroidia bacterium]
MTKAEELEALFVEYKRLGIDQQIDYDKFYLYSIITHSTAIEGSTVTEIENQLLLDQGITSSGRTIVEQMMNLDLKAAYERCLIYASEHTQITVDILKELSSLVMKNTGSTYSTALGEFSSAKGDLRLLNVTAGIGGNSYLSYAKVPSKLKEFCEELNIQRIEVGRKGIIEKYLMSFDAHYNLVTIHPWADGNGRMSRLLMNMLQFENGLIPTKIRKEDKAEYIKALVETREKDDINIFRDFMMDVMIGNLKQDILAFERSSEALPINPVKKEKSREKILKLISQNSSMTTAQLAAEIGISAKAVEKHIANLKKAGLLTRVGPDKGGHWEVHQ